MIIISYLINFVSGLLFYCFFWLACPAFFSPNINKWIMFGMFGLGAILVLGAFSALKGGDADGRFRTGHRGNITPDLPSGCISFYIAINCFLIGSGFIFFKNIGSMSNVFFYTTLAVFIINGFLIPVAGLFMPEE